MPLKHKTCTILGGLNVEGVAMAVGAHFVSLQNDHEIEEKITAALELSTDGKPVVVNINIDYSKKPMLTKGVISTNLKRFPLKEKIRFLARAAKRHLLE